MIRSRTRPLYLLAGAVVVCTAASVSAARDRSAPRLLVLGVDGMTFDIVDPMVAAGKLPNIAALLGRGARAVLVSERPMRSPALWTTIATGQPRRVHGIYDFVTGSQFWPKTERADERRLVTSDMRKVAALWDYAGSQGIHSLVVGWLNTWPAETLKGAMLAPYVALNDKRQSSIKGRLYKDIKNQSYPPELFKAVAANILAPENVSKKRVTALLDAPPAKSALYQAVPRLRRYLYATRWSLASALTHVRIVEQLLAEQPELRLVMTYFDGSDTLAHRFWTMREPVEMVKARLEAHGMDPGLAPELKRRFGKVLEGYYALVDEALGRMMRVAGPDTTVIIISDHGWGSSGLVKARFDTVPFDGEHKMAGVFMAAGPEIRPVRLKRLTLYDMAPTMLYLLGVPIAKALPGRLPKALIRKQILASRPPTRVFAAAAVPRPKAGDTKAKGESAPHQEEEIERLRSLGYVQ